MYIRSNYQIKHNVVRVIQDGKNIGIMPISNAIDLAKSVELDLVEVSNSSKPPVCHITDLGKFKYELKIKNKKNKQKNVSTLKEVCFRPVTDKHDVEIKTNQIVKFIESGKIVQIRVKFRKSRELAHKENGFQIVKEILSKLNLIATVDESPKMMGKDIICRIRPKNEK